MADHDDRKDAEQATPRQPPAGFAGMAAAERGAALAATHFRVLADLAPEGIAFHEDGAVLYANPALLKLLGAREAQEVVGRRTIDFVHPSSRAVVVDRIRRMLSDGAPVEPMEEVFLRLDGSPVDVEVVAAPCGGHAIMVHVRDISARKRVERELETTRRFLQEVLDRCPNVIFVKDDLGRYVLVNEAMARAHGSSHEGLIGLTNEQVHPLPEFAVQHLAEDLETLRQGNPVVADEPFVLPDGRRLIYQTVKTAIALPDGSRGVLGVSNDITAIKEAEAAARQLNQELERRVAQRTAALSAVNQSLEQRVQFERLIGDIASDFARGGAAQWDVCVDTALARCGPLLRADHVFTVLLPKDWRQHDGVREWCRPEISPVPQRFTLLHAPSLAWIGEALAARQIIRLGAADPIPASIDQVREILRELHIGALILVPITAGGRLQGYLGADRIDWDEAWSEAEAQMLATIASILASALERQRAELALRQSEQHLANIVAACPDAISISSMSSGLYVTASPAFKEVFGWSPKEVIGRPAVDIGLWLSAADRDGLVAKVRQDGRVRNYEQRFRHRSGRVFEALLSATIIEIAGEPCMLAITRDISHLKAAEHKLNRQNTLLNALARAQADFILDAEPKATFSRLLDNLLAVSESEYGFIGEVLHDQDGSPYLRAFAITDISWDDMSRALYQQYVDGSFEFRNLKTLFGHVLASGETVIANDPANDPRRGGLPPGHRALDGFLGLPLHRGDRLVGMIGVANRRGGYDEAVVQELDPLLKTCALLIEAFRSAHARQAAEEALRRLAGELEQRVRARTEELQLSLKELESFSYSVSHDLRSPLRSINGFAQALARLHGQGLGEQGRDYLRRIDQATVRMGQLIDDLLRLAQLTRAPLKRERVNLSQLARQVLAELRAADPSRQVEEIITDGLETDADPTLMLAVLENLLGNAWKFTRRQPLARIEFGALARDNAAVYYVRDNGIGFDMQYVDRIFDVFQRLHGPEDFPGTGIGLATVQRIVQRHGGRCWAEGTQDAGACFYFTLGRESAGDIVVDRSLS
ncbi:Phytochrome-like protein cph1 [Burkholderiales bacterium]|nr:MAG: PAS domain S-box protein [Burkholderiales bacterium]CAG0982053.1 Phytochrome-like protein cph1 [Burkholderiales bacterium]